MIRLPFLLVAVLFLFGCGRKERSPDPQSEPAYTRQYRNGPATLIASLSETNLPAWRRLYLQLDVHAQNGSSVEFPDLEMQLEAFTVLDAYTEPPQLLPNGRQLFRKTWVLAPSTAGKTTLPAMEATAGGITLHTESISMDVTSMLPPDATKLEIRDIAPPIAALPQQEKQRKAWIIAVSLFIGMALAYLLAKTLKRKRATEQPTAHETAEAALRDLPEDPVQCIHAVASILKTYLEQRHGLPLAGKTVDECIPLLPERRRDELADFLKTSEQVRFSNKVPDGYVDEAIQLVRDYVQETKEEACD